MGDWNYQTSDGKVFSGGSSYWTEKEAKDHQANLDREAAERAEYNASVREYNAIVEEYNEHFRNAQSLRDNGDYDGAIDEINIALGIFQEPGAYCVRGSCYFEKKDYGRALAEYNYGLSLPNGRYSAIHSHRAHLYFDRGDYDNAIGDYIELIKSKGNNESSGFNPSMAKKWIKFITPADWYDGPADREDPADKDYDGDW